MPATDRANERSTWLPSLCLLLGAAVAACGSSSLPDHEIPSSTASGAAVGAAVGSGGSGPDLHFGGSGGSSQQIVDLAFNPPSATLTLDGVTPQAASFILQATLEGGDTIEVTPESLEFDRPDLASLQPGSPILLTAPGAYAGVGALHGILDGKEAAATLTVVVHAEDVDPSVPADVVDKLKQDGLEQDPSLGSLLYPYDATVFPQGLASPLLMWDAPSASDVYRVHYEEDNYTFDGFYPITLPASARVPQSMWDKIVASNPGGPLEVELSRWDAAADTAYVSASETWHIAPATLRGTIYYWTTSGGGQMARINPGGTWESLNGGACMGCHAVSSDGSTLVAAVEGQTTNDGSGDSRAWVSFNLPDMSVRSVSSFFAGNVAVNNDGQFVVFGSQTLRLGDTATGLEIPGSGLDALPLEPGMKGLMTPTFSPDGKRLAAIEGSGGWYHDLTGGRLVVMDFDAQSRTVSGFTGLAAASAFANGQSALAYPTFSPDSNWIAFHSGDYATGCDAQGCDDAATQIGTLFIQSVSGTPPVAMTTMADGPNKAEDKNRAFEPTFNPIERGGYFWVVFTSMRDYGNRLTGAPNNGKKRLWVAAIDKNPGSTDPSHPAFFLEGQDETTTNMRGFWTLSACIPTGGGGCEAGFECCSGFCDQGECVTPQDFACVGVGEACSATSDCCNNSVVSCDAGKCSTTVPK